MRRGYVLLGAAAFLVGALAPLTVSASEYDQMGRIADGVFLVTSEEDRFRIQADEATGVLVYKPAGELVLARQLDAGDEHAFVLDGGEAVVALSGGPAILEATGAGDVTELDTTSERVELAQADGGPVDRRLTIELPRLLVGVTGTLDGDADDLVVEGSTDEATAFRVVDGEIDRLERRVVPSALDAGFLDVHVNATRLNGTVELALVTPDLPRSAAVPASAPAEPDEPETNPSPSIASASNAPMLFTVDDEAALAFDVEHGYLLDASVYDADGAQVWHTHRGPDVAQARTHCSDVTDCQRPWAYHREETVGPQTIEHTLGEGTYLLYVRAGDVHGNWTLEDADGHTMVDDVEELELTSMEVSGGQSVSFDAPLLDVYVRDWGPSLERNVTVSVDGTLVHAYEATASGYQYSLDSHRIMKENLLEAGEVEVSTDGFRDPQHGGHVELFTTDLDAS